MAKRKRMRNTKRELELERKRYALNPEPKRAYHRQWTRDNRKKVYANNKRWRDANKDMLASSKLWLNYGITLLERDRLMAEQGMQCAGCKASFWDMAPKNIHVDHCHTTKKVRGILCSSCNLILGKARDNPDTLRCLATYLEVK